MCGYRHKYDNSFHFIFNWICVKTSVILHLCFIFLKALITLKKGSKLIKYSRKGKPKIRTFRLSSVSSYVHCFMIQILTPQISLYIKEITSLDGSALQDETTLVWYSHSKEKCLVLSSVSRIIPGQRTVSRNTTLQLPVYHRVRWFLSFFLTVKLDGYFAAMQSQLKLLMNFFKA